MIAGSRELGPLERMIVGVITVCILLVAVLRFSGIPDQYALMFEFSKNPNQYPNDLYLNNTFFFDASYFFSINSLLGQVLSPLRQVSQLCSFGP